jgi:hypothetical protein
MEIIKQYGLERTGTNYIKALLEYNLEDSRVLSNMFGLKHEKYIKPNLVTYNPNTDKNVITDIPPGQIAAIKNKFINKEIYYVIIIKNPYSWVISYNNCQWIAANNGPLNKDKINRYIKRWNTVNKDWIDNILKPNTDKSFGVFYNDLISQPDVIIKMISEKFNIPISPVFKNINNLMVPGTDVCSSKNISGAIFNKKDYYLNEGYMKEIHPQFIEIINNSIDNDIIKYFNKWSIMSL